MSTRRNQRLTDRDRLVPRNWNPDPFAVADVNRSLADRFR